MKGFAVTGMLVTMFMLFTVMVTAWKSVGMVAMTSHLQERQLQVFLHAANAVQEAQRLIVARYDELIKKGEINHIIMSDAGELWCGPVAASKQCRALKGVVCRLTGAYHGARYRWIFCIARTESLYVCSPIKMSVVSKN